MNAQPNSKAVSVPGTAVPGTVAYLGQVAGSPGRACKAFIDALYADPVLDPKVRELIFLGIQTALGAESSVRAHVPRAMRAGATRDEIVAAMMISIPNGGIAGALKFIPLLDEIARSE